MSEVAAPAAPIPKLSVGHTHTHVILKFGEHNAALEPEAAINLAETLRAYAKLVRKGRR